MARPQLPAICALCSIIIFLLFACNVSAIFVVTNTNRYVASHAAAAFGPNPKLLNISANAVVAATDLCNDSIGQDYNDKIVIVLRGACNFYEKALNAQTQKALALVVGNTKNELLRMGLPDGVSHDEVVIPTVMVTLSVYEQLVEWIQNEPAPDGGSVSSTPLLLAHELSSAAPRSPSEAIKDHHRARLRSRAQARQDHASMVVTAAADALLPAPLAMLTSVLAAEASPTGVAPVGFSLLDAPSAPFSSGASVRAPGDGEYLVSLEVSKRGQATPANWGVPDALVYVMLAIPIAFCLFFICGLTRRLCRRRILREQAIDVGKVLPLSVFVPAGARLVPSNAMERGAEPVVTKDTMAVSRNGAIRVLRSEVIASDQVVDVGVRAEATMRAQPAFPQSGGFVLGGDDDEFGAQARGSSSTAPGTPGRGSNVGSDETIQMSPLRPDGRSSSASVISSPAPVGAGEREIVMFAVTVPRGERTCGDALASGTPSGAASPSSPAAASPAGGGQGSASGEIPLTRPPTHQRIHGDSCSICLEEYVAGMRIKPLPCGHAFHAPCLDGWLQRITGDSVRCPTCNTDILPGLEQRRWEEASCATKFYRVFCGCEPCTRRVRAQSPEDRQRAEEERHGYEGY